MRQKQLKVCLTILLACGLTVFKAQENISASGGDALDSSGSVNYSVGQVFYTNSGLSETISEGVQQAYEISDVTGINNVTSTFSLSLFPNPINDLLILQTNSVNLRDLFYQIIDINNKLIESKNMTSTDTKIIMTDYSSGIYFINIIQQKKLIKSFKVIKT